MSAAVECERCTRTAIKLSERIPYGLTPDEPGGANPSKIGGWKNDENQSPLALNESLGAALMYQTNYGRAIFFVKSLINFCSIDVPPSLSASLIFSHAPL